MLAVIYIAIWCLGLFFAIYLLVFIVKKIWNGRFNEHDSSEIIEIDLEAKNMDNGSS